MSVSRIELAGEGPLSIVIPSYGDNVWRERALETAASLARHQTKLPREVLCVHADTLAEARNLGGADATGEWLCFLDATDDLDNEFTAAFGWGAWRGLHAVDDLDHIPIPGPHLWRISVRGFNREGFIEEPHMCEYPTKIQQGNTLTIGSPVLRQTFLDVGGFDPRYPCLEDWELWIRILKYGPRIGDCKPAVYLINDEHGRNTHPNINEVAQAIRRRHYG